MEAMTSGLDGKLKRWKMVLYQNDPCSFQNHVWRWTEARVMNLVLIDYHEDWIFFIAEQYGRIVKLTYEDCVGYHDKVCCRTGFGQSLVIRCCVCCYELHISLSSESNFSYTFECKSQLDLKSHSVSRY